MLVAWPRMPICRPMNSFGTLGLHFKIYMKCVSSTQTLEDF
jgi:hypothetical protein